MTTLKLTKGIQVNYQTALTEKQLRRMIRKAEKDNWTVEILKKNMCNCINIEIGSYGNQVELPRPAHMKGFNEGTSSDTICVDACLKDEILELWSQGIRTTGCCCGHNYLTPYIGVDESQIETMKSMGYIVQPNECGPEHIGREQSFKPKTILNSNQKTTK